MLNSEDEIFIKIASGTQYIAIESWKCFYSLCQQQEVIGNFKGIIHSQLLVINSYEYQ